MSSHASSQAAESPPVPAGTKKTLLWKQGTQHRAKAEHGAQVWGPWKPTPVRGQPHCHLVAGVIVSISFPRQTTSTPHMVLGPASRWLGQTLLHSPEPEQGRPGPQLGITRGPLTFCRVHTRPSPLFPGGAQALRCLLACFRLLHPQCPFHFVLCPGNQRKDFGGNHSPF